MNQIFDTIILMLLLIITIRSLIAQNFDILWLLVLTKMIRIRFYVVGFMRETKNLIMVQV